MVFNYFIIKSISDANLQHIFDIIKCFYNFFYPNIVTTPLILQNTKFMIQINKFHRQKR